jgi:putative protein kinase ArgK-like GTPase of G3E family
MSASKPIHTLPTTADIIAGDIRAGALLMRMVDDRQPLALTALKQLFPHTGRAYIVGITGNPGAGKSTVVDAMISHYRAAGERVGIVAIDPTSPFSGGAILGDRIRTCSYARLRLADILAACRGQPLMWWPSSTPWATAAF